MGEDKSDEFGTWSGNKPLVDGKPQKAMSRRVFLKAAVGIGAGLVGNAPGAGNLARLANRSTDSSLQTEAESLDVYSECEYILRDASLELRAKRANGEERNLAINIDRKDLPISESGYHPTEYEVVIDDDLNPNYNCHSFALGQVAGIEDIGTGTNVWIDSPDMQTVLDTFGKVGFEASYTGDGKFVMSEELHENDLMALYDINGNLLHTGIYHTNFNGLDTSEAPYVSKFGGDKLMARSLNAVVRNYWLNLPYEEETIIFKVYRFDESFKFEPAETNQ